MLVSNMALTASPTAKPIDQGLTPIKLAAASPIDVVKMCPKIIFLGCASGLCGNPNKITIVAPKGAISQIEEGMIVLKLLKIVIQSIAPNPASKVMK